MRLTVVAIQVGILAAILACWQASSSAGLLDPLLLPSPSVVFGAVMDLMQDPVFIENSLITLGRVALAFVIGAPIAIGSGFLIAERPMARQTFEPIINFFLGVPKSTLVPIFIQIFGVGTLQKVVFGVSHLYFVLTTITIAAARSVPQQQILAARSFGANQGRIYWSIHLPAMLPTIVNGLRLALIFDVAGVLIAEMFAAQSGIGQLIARWGEQYKTPKLMGGIIIISCCTIVLNEGMQAVQRLLSRGKRPPGYD